MDWIGIRTAAWLKRRPNPRYTFIFLHSRSRMTVWTRLRRRIRKCFQLSSIHPISSFHERFCIKLCKAIICFRYRALGVVFSTATHLQLRVYSFFPLRKNKPYIFYYRHARCRVCTLWWFRMPINTHRSYVQTHARQLTKCRTQIQSHLSLTIINVTLFCK